MNFKDAKYASEYCYLFNTEEEYRTITSLLRRLQNKSLRSPWPAIKVHNVALFEVDNEPFLNDENKSRFNSEHKRTIGTDYPFSMKPYPYKAGIKFYADLDNANFSFASECDELYGLTPLTPEAGWMRSLYVWAFVSPCVDMETLTPHNRQNIHFHTKDCRVSFPPEHVGGAPTVVYFRKGDVQLAQHYNEQKTDDELMSLLGAQKPIEEVLTKLSI
jgi:hypothetical protein